MSSFSRKSCREWNDKYLTSNSVAFVFILIEQDEWNAAFRSYGGNGQWSNCHPLTKNVKKETKIQPPTSTVDQEQALANLLDDRISTDPQTTHPQPPPSTTKKKTHNLNVCPFHECNLILFEARTNGNVYIKYQMDQCPIFMHEDSTHDAGPLNFFQEARRCRLPAVFLSGFYAGCVFFSENPLGKRLIAQCSWASRVLKLNCRLPERAGSQM